MKKANKTDKPRWGINWKATGIASLAASVALSLGLILGSATKKNKNYQGDNMFFHNLKEMAGGKKNLEWSKPVPILTGRMLITHDGEPYEVKDSIRVFFDVDEHFTLDTRVINGKGYDELQNIMREVALGRDSSSIVGFDFVKKGVKPNVSSQKTKIGSVKGYASPEAIKYEGSSLRIGNIESENIRTAEYRAEIGRDSLVATLTKIAVDNPDLDIDTSSIKVSGDEIQLNEEELKILEDLAYLEGYSSVESMICANDDGKIENKSTSEAINKIISSKRQVVVTFTKKGNPDTIYVVPLVFLPILVFKRKRTGTEGGESGGGGTGTGGGRTGTEGGRTGTEGGKTGTEGGGTGTEGGRTGTEGGRTGTEGGKTGTEGGESGGGGTGTEGGRTGTEGGRTGTEGGKTGTEGGESGGGGTQILIDGPWPRPWPESRSSKSVAYQKSFTGRGHTGTPRMQRKQPKDNKRNYFRSEKQKPSGNNRRGNTKKN